MENKLNKAKEIKQIPAIDHKQLALTSAIESLTELVKPASNIIESNLLTTKEIPSNQKPIPEQKAEKLQPLDSLYRFYLRLHSGGKRSEVNIKLPLNSVLFISKILLLNGNISY